MTIENLFNILNSVTGMNGKVVYEAWPENSAPAMPFICFYVNDYVIMYADDMPYYTSGTATVELYTDDREITTEVTLETALIAAGLSYEKTVEYIDTEKCYMVTYTMSL